VLNIDVLGGCKEGGSVTSVYELLKTQNISLRTNAVSIGIPPAGC
jgi:hypothetical protein